MTGSKSASRGVDRTYPNPTQMQGELQRRRDFPGTVLVEYLDPWKDITLRQYSSEGYRYDEYMIGKIKREQLQALADWMITLPEELYAPIAGIHRKLERLLQPGGDR